MANKKILLVEDDAIEAMDIKRILESFGYEVPHIASRGDEAVKKAAEIIPDLILMDIILKGEINGIEAASKIKNLDIPLIFLTAHSEDATVQKAKLTEPYGYIIKPFDSAELRYAIELALYKSKMEKNLKVREGLLNSIINNSPILQFVIDKNHRVLYWNQALAAYSGISAEEIVGTHDHWKAFYSEKRPCLADLMVDEDLKTINKWYGGKYNESEHLKGAFQAEDFFQSLGEDGKWLHFTAAAIKDEKGNVIGALETLEDINERKKAEKTVKDQFNFLQNLINTLPYPLFYKDTDFRYIGCNKAFEEFIGLSKDEIIGKTVYEVSPKELADKYHEKDRELFENPGSQSYEAPVQYADGSRHIVLFNKTTFDDEGSLAGLIGLMVDITDRKKAERDLRASESFLNDIINQSPYPMWISDSEGTLIRINQACLRMLNITEEEVVGKYNLFEDNIVESQGYMPLIESVFKEGQNVRFELIYDTSLLKHLELENFSKIYLDVTVFPVKNSDGKVTNAVIQHRNITDSKKAEKELIESEEKFREVFNNANDAFYLLKITENGVNENFTEVNDVASQMLGYTGEEFLKMSPKDIDASDSSFLANNWEKIIKNGSAIFETVHETKNGKKIPVEINARIFNIKGKKTLLAIVRDISERKSAEIALKKSETEYKAIFENIKSAVAVYNAVNNGSDFVFKDFNRSAEKIEQIKRENVIGKKVTEVFPGVVEFGLLEVFDRVWKTGKPEKHPVSIYEDERIKGWRENYVYKLPSGDIVAVYDDLTEIKQYEEELEQNQTRLRSLVRILQYRAGSVQDFLDYALEEAIGLTESKIGYIYYYYEDRKEFVLNTWSDGVMDECSITDQQTIYELDKTGIWGEAVRQRKPIILNDFKAPNPLKKGYPEGHASLHKFMTIPVFRGDEIVAVVGVANKEADYTETDVLQMELLMDSVWKVVDSQRAEDALKKSETRYRAIFENTGTATAISEDNMILSLVNEEFANLTGFSKDEIENKLTWVDFFIDEELPRMREYHKLRRIDPDAAPRNYESVLKDKWGNYKDVYMSVTMLPDMKKSLVSVLDITEKKQSRIELRRELKIDQSLAKIYAPLISPLTTIQDISIVILKEALSLSGSEHGFVATIDPKNQDLINQILTRMMPQCEVYEDGKIPEEIRFPIGPDGFYSGLWGYCLNTKEAFYTNEAGKHPSAKGTPEGHVEIEKFMAVPVLIDDELVGEIALANPPENDYSTYDLKAVKRIAEFFALAIQRKGYEEQIKKSLDEKDLLLREIHHRVKNNMQIISSMLNLQSFSITDSKLLDILKQNQNRIKSMAMIHEKLYQSHNLVQIDFSDYIQSLTADIYYTYSIQVEGLEIDLDLESDIMLNIETSIPCGLIYSELLSNSIKHAFPNNNQGKISVEFKREGDDLILRVSDNGVGLPEEIDFRKTGSLGLQLVNSLVKQIDGTIELDQGQGTTFTVKFQELKYKDRI